MSQTNLVIKKDLQGFFQQFWEKAPGQVCEIIIDLTSKLGEINDIEHNKGNKIYPQNQVILDCIMQSIPLKHKCLSTRVIFYVRRIGLYLYKYRIYGTISIYILKSLAFVYHLI